MQYVIGIQCYVKSTFLSICLKVSHTFKLGIIIIIIIIVISEHLYSALSF